MLVTLEEFMEGKSRKQVAALLNVYPPAISDWLDRGVYIQIKVDKQGKPRYRVQHNITMLSGSKEPEFEEK